MKLTSIPRKLRTGVRKRLRKFEKQHKILAPAAEGTLAIGAGIGIADGFVKWAPVKDRVTTLVQGIPVLEPYHETFIKPVAEKFNLITHRVRALFRRR